MNISFVLSEQERQHYAWKAARQRLEANAIKKAPKPKITEIPVCKGVDIVQEIECGPAVRDWLIVASVEQKTCRVDEIYREVCKQFFISKVDFISHRRTKPLVDYRQIGMTLAKALTLRSLPDIGRRTGGRDHTTVLHACRKWEPIMEQVKRRIQPDAPVETWVSAFIEQMELTPIAPRKIYTKRENA